MSTGTLLADIPVGNSPSSIAVNPDTNMIYVTNRNSGTVSVINGNTNNLTAGITFNADPTKGKIVCNNQDVPNNYTRFAIGMNLTCIAVSNPESAFSWLDLNEMIYRSLFNIHYNKIVFDSWSDPEWVKNSSDNPIKFIVSHYGTTLTAKFKDAPPPPNYVNTVMIPAMFIIIPTVLAWLFKRRPKRSGCEIYHSRFIKAIEAAADTSIQNKDESKQHLVRIRNEMTNQYIQGKITDEQYKMLDSKISYYIKKE